MFNKMAAPSPKVSRMARSSSAFEPSDAPDCERSIPSLQHQDRPQIEKQKCFIHDFHAADFPHCHRNLNLNSTPPRHGQLWDRYLDEPP